MSNTNQTGAMRALIVGIAIIFVTLIASYVITKPRDYYTVTNKKFSSARCLAIGPMCETESIELQSSSGHKDTFTFYHPEVVDKQGHPVDITRVHAGSKVKIETSQPTDKFIKKFIVLE